VVAVAAHQVTLGLHLGVEQVLHRRRGGARLFFAHDWAQVRKGRSRRIGDRCEIVVRLSKALGCFIIKTRWSMSSQEDRELPP